MPETICSECKQKNAIITVLSIGIISCIVIFSAYVYQTDKLVQQQKIVPAPSTSDTP